MKAKELIEAVVNGADPNKLLEAESIEIKYLPHRVRFVCSSDGVAKELQDFLSGSLRAYGLKGNMRVQARGNVVDTPELNNADQNAVEDAVMKRAQSVGWSVR